MMTISLTCPECNRWVTHDTIWYTQDEDTKAIVTARLHCPKCEHVWTEVMQHG